MWDRVASIFGKLVTFSGESRYFFCMDLITRKLSPAHDLPAVCYTSGKNPPHQIRKQLISPLCFFFFSFSFSKKNLSV